MPTKTEVAETTKSTMTTTKVDANVDESMTNKKSDADEFDFDALIAQVGGFFFFTISNSIFISNNIFKKSEIQCA